jgi:predicted nuclease of predicted toxin-antitoxin system
VKLKLDENLPVRAIAPLRALGHDVDTVNDEGLAGAGDPEVLRAATGVGRLIITMDRGFGDIRSYPPGTHCGVLVVRVDEQAAPAVAGVVELIARTVDLDDLAGCVAVFRDGGLRVRRPLRPAPGEAS